MGEDVTAIEFDAVMEKIIEAPSPMSIEFEVPAPARYPMGSTVSIKVLQKGKPDLTLKATVGENLRQVLLANNVEVYQGMKQKLGNCGGGGQCTFCAVDFVDSDGWTERSVYENGKLGKYPNARLSCLNNIQGPATIQM